MITKHIVLGSLQIDPIKHTIWVNSHECVLRIQGVSITNVEEKFSMIDVRNDLAVMYPIVDEIERDLKEEELAYFIGDIAAVLSKELYERKDIHPEEFLSAVRKNFLEFLEINEENK